MLTQELLKEYLSYDPETGAFTWIKRPSQAVKVGDIAGHLDLQGYIVIGLKGKVYKAHRLAWLYCNSDPGEQEIDHKDTDRTNNRLCNLRLANDSENARNSKISNRNTSGHKGVYWCKREKKWFAAIRVNTVLKNLGYSKDKQVAINKIAKARNDLHGEFANHG